MTEEAKLIALGTNECTYFIGSERTAPCKRCGGSWQQHAEPVPYVTDPESAAQRIRGVQCEHCLTVHQIDAERCPGCGLRNSIDSAVANLGANQDTCSHEQLTRTQVGGYTCDRCGLYLFRKPDEAYQPYPTN